MLATKTQIIAIIAPNTATGKTVLACNLQKYLKHCNVRIIDNPNQNELNQADIILTPFIYNQCLESGLIQCNVQQNGKAVVNTTPFSEMLWQAKKEKLKKDQITQKWFWLINKSPLGAALITLPEYIQRVCGRWGVRFIYGLSDMPIFCEENWLDQPISNISQVLAHTELHLIAKEILP